MDSETTKDNTMSQSMFDRLMGDCAGIEMAKLTEMDVRVECEEWRKQGESVSGEEEELAVAGLLEYQEEVNDDEPWGTFTMPTSW